MMNIINKGSMNTRGTDQIVKILELVDKVRLLNMVLSLKLDGIIDVKVHGDENKNHICEGTLNP